MEAQEARDHLRMLDGIVRSTDRTLHIHPLILMTVGLVTTLVTALIQLRQMGVAIPPDEYVQPPAMLGMLAVIGGVAWRGRRAGRASLVDGYAGAVFLAAFAVATALNVTAQHRVISPEGMALVWAGTFSMVLLINGAIGRSVPLFGGGVALLAATAAASLVPGWLPGVLSVGWFCGFFVPGLVLALRAPDGRVAAV